MMILNFLLAAFLMSAAPAGPARVYPDDFKPLLGKQWVGSLSYKDHQSGEMTKIPAHLQVGVSIDDPYVWVFQHSYPDEPQSNSADTFRIAKSGRKIDGEKVISRTETKIGSLQLITLKRSGGTQHRYTYFIGIEAFGVQHEEKGKKDPDFFVRNTYMYEKG